MNRRKVLAGLAGLAAIPFAGNAIAQAAAGKMFCMEVDDMTPEEKQNFIDSNTWCEGSPGIPMEDVPEGVFLEMNNDDRFGEIIWADNLAGPINHATQTRKISYAHGDGKLVWVKQPDFEKIRALPFDQQFMAKEDTPYKWIQGYPERRYGVRVNFEGKAYGPSSKLIIRRVVDFGMVTRLPV